MLTQAATLANLWPAGSVIVQRPADDSLDWLPTKPDWRERSSAVPLAFAGTVPILCHEAGATPAGLQLLRECGFRLPSEIVTFRSFRQMRELVTEQINRGRRIGITYSARETLAPVEAHVTAPESIAYLNDKTNLPELLPPGSFPERRVVPAREVRLAADALNRWPVVLKAASRLGTGAGADVVICPTPDDIEPARRVLAAADHLVVEAFVRFQRTWCLSFGIGEEDITYYGAAEQICDERGTYLGNWCLGSDPGTDAIAWAGHAARAGQTLGYRGFFGVDAGRSETGATYVFDLNYRNNGSTPQVLLRDSIAQAWDAPVTRSCFGVPFNGSYDELIERLGSLLSRREVVPLLTFDTKRLGLDDERPLCNLLVAGRDTRAVEDRAAALREMGFEIKDVPAPRVAP